MKETKKLKNFPFTVKGVIEKHIVDHHQGLSTNEINEIYTVFVFGVDEHRGGLYPISKTQFNAFSEEMNTRQQKLLYEEKTSAY